MQFKQDIDDRRIGARLAYRVYVQVTLTSNQTTFDGWSDTVSVSGLSLEAELPPEYLDQPALVTITFSGEHSNLVIDNLKSKVVRCNDGVVGISFLHPLEWFVLFSVYQGKMHSNKGHNTPG